MSHLDQLLALQRQAVGGEGLAQRRLAHGELVAALVQPLAGSVEADGAEIVVEAGAEGLRFLLVSGQPIEEPVAWYGPIVMNTQSELEQAARELRDGTFIKRG